MLLCLQTILFLTSPMNYLLPLTEQSKWQTLSIWMSNFRVKYFIHDIPLHFQFFISISRFLALTESDHYYRYTLKWPFVQLLLPFIISIGMAHTSVFWSNFFTHNDIETTFWFMMAGMDFVTNKNLQKLKRKEMGIVKWAEEMLMWQMLSTSLMNVLIAFFDVPSFISSLFCGPYLTSVIGSFLNLFKNLLYFFVSSILNASLLQKPRQLQKD